MQVGSSYCCDSVLYESTRNGADVANRGCVISMSAFQSARPVLRSGSAASSNAESSFRGFLYAPIQGTQVAWSVHVNSGYSLYTGPVPYVIIYVNTGSPIPWQSSQQKVVIPAAGTYLIEFTGITWSGPVDMYMILNGNTVLARLYMGYSNSWILRSRAVIVYLRLNDQVQIVCQTPSSFNGNLAQGVSFMGILLYQN